MAYSYVLGMFDDKHLPWFLKKNPTKQQQSTLDDKGLSAAKLKESTTSISQVLTKKNC